MFMTGQPEPTSLSWGFSTLGCPELSLPEVCALAAEFAMPNLELRALCGRVDLPTCAEEMGWRPEVARELITRNSCRLAVAGSSFKLVGNNDAMRADFLKYCDWADSWGAPYVRVFGGGTWGQGLTDADFEQAAETVRWWRKERAARGWQTDVLLETHDAFSAAAPCAELMRLLDVPVGVIWDSHHTWRLGGESPSDSWSCLSAWVRHVHLKDSIDKPSARHPFTYVLPGDGQAPLAAIVSLLCAQQFAGSVSLEWEKLWHPYLPPLRTALVQLQAQPWFAARSQGRPSASVGR
jgi:sugar phosphate isomerase/epimerase